MHSSFAIVVLQTLLSLFDWFRSERDFRACPGLSLSKLQDRAGRDPSGPRAAGASSDSRAQGTAVGSKRGTFMSIKSKVLAAAATLTLVSGVGMAGALTAGFATAGTPSCGPGCVNTYNKDFVPGVLTG